MGLEAPWALFGVVLAAAPIIAHLVRLRDLPRVPLPTIALLRRAQVASQRRSRLVDLLLLLTRVALIVALAVALAAPYRSVKLAYGDGTPATVAIVLDDSLSMTSVGASGAAPYAAAVARARDVVMALPPGSEAAVVLGGRAPRVLVARTQDLPAALRLLTELGETPPTRGTDLAGAVSLAIRELAGGRLEARRVLVLTDGAAHARAETLEVPGDVALEIERLGPTPSARPSANVSVASANAVPDPTAAGRASVLVELRASGDAPVGVLALRLERAGTTVARAEATFSGGVARVTMLAPLAGADDDPTARVVVDARDALAADNARGLLLRSASSLRILVVGDGASSQPVMRALALVPQHEGSVDARLVDADTLATIDLASYDAVLLADSAAPGEVTAGALQSFVEHGGGIIIAPGEAADGRALEGALGRLLPARPRGVAPCDPPLGLQSGGGESPLSDITGLTGTAVRQRLLVESPRGGAQVPLVFTDGAPALIVSRMGAGRVALLATSLDESWADLPLRPGFLPLVARLVREVATAARAPDRPIAPGERVELPLPPGATRLVVTGPDGERESFDGVTTASFGRTTIAGAYRVEVAHPGGVPRDAPRLAFVVAAPTTESDLTPGPAPAANASRGERRAAVTTVRRSLAQWFFLAAGLLAVAEGALRLRWPRTAKG